MTSSRPATLCLFGLDGSRIKCLTDVDATSAFVTWWRPRNPGFTSYLFCRLNAQAKEPILGKINLCVSSTIGGALRSAPAFNHAHRFGFLRAEVTGMPDLMMPANRRDQRCVRVCR
jgi:hypothetical protein